MEYKLRQSEFMRNINGTSGWETFSSIYPSFFCIFISTTVTSLVLNHIPLPKHKSFIFQFLIEFFLIIIPLILNITILSDYTAYYILFMELISIFVFYIFHLEIWNNPITMNSFITDKRYFITNARTTITVISIIAILAVDFNIFPRRYAKTEFYGYSLMDVGVGLFVFANGIVAPELKKKSTNLKKSLTSCIPLLVLGMARFFLTNETDYYVPVSEYGVHWNFFITLAVTKIFSSVILKFIDIDNAFYISIFLLIIHEILLQIGLAEWVFSNTPRNNFIQANKEGISASLGYVALYFLSVYVGNIITLFNFKLEKKLSYALALLSAVSISLTLLFEQYFGISRRLANAAYCFWTIFLGTFMCLLFLIGEFVKRYLYKISKIKIRIFVPLIFEAISFNALPCFLLANILTGLVNMCMETIYVPWFYSLLILITYMLINCSIMSLLYVKNVKLKVW